MIPTVGARAARSLDPTLVVYRDSYFASLGSSTIAYTGADGIDRVATIFTARGATGPIAVGAIVEER